MAGGGKHKLEYIQQDCPKFLREFKDKVNYKEGATIETKRKKLESDDSGDAEEREDEKPVICVLKPGDLTEEEFERAKSEIEQKEEGGNYDTATEPGKFVFKKPTKKSEENEEQKHKKKPNEKSKSKKVKDTKLLSFGDEEEEDL